MLLYDLNEIGNRLHAIRKKLGLTQSEVSERAGLSDRTYADIERGTVNMRVETLLKICDALYITLDEILTSDETPLIESQDKLFDLLLERSPKDRETALTLLAVYLKSNIK